MEDSPRDDLNLAFMEHSGAVDTSADSDSAGTARGGGGAAAVRDLLAKVDGSMKAFRDNQTTLEESRRRRDELEALLLRKETQLEKMRDDAGKRGETRRLASLHVLCWQRLFFSRLALLLSLLFLAALST